MKSDYSSLNRSQPDYYITQLSEEEKLSFSQSQMQILHKLLNAAIPKPSPKIIDLKFTVDLLFDKFYVVLFLGKERRRNLRPINSLSGNRILNLLVALFLLISINLTLSLTFFMLIYLLKSISGINLIEGSLKDFVTAFFN
jgi:hypothetical protein